MEIIIACKNDKEKTGRLKLLKKISLLESIVTILCCMDPQN